MNEHSSNTGKIIGAILGLAIIGGIVAWVFGFNKASTPDLAITTPAEGTTTTPTATSSTPTTTPVTTPGTTPVPTPAATKYKDGTYTAQGAYVSPGGGETVTVGITLKGDTIVDSSFKGGASFGDSAGWMRQFGAGYKQLVVGKKIDSVKLGVVNGSSLTPVGFMDALAKIKSQAKS